MTQITPPNFTQIPNVIFDYWMPRLKAAESCVLLVLCRKTFGWHKTSDTISRNQLMKCTGLSKNTIKDALDGLEKHGLITKIQETCEYGNKPNKFHLNIQKPIDTHYIDQEDLGGVDQNLGGGRSEFDQGVGQNLTKGVGQNLTTQKKDYTKEKEDIPDSANASPASSPPSVLLAVNVRVTESENTTLLKQHPPLLIQRAAEKLSEWKQQYPKKAKGLKSDYLALRKWALTAAREEQIKEKELQQREDRIKRVDAEAKPISKSRDKSLEHVQRKKITIGGSE